MALGAVCLTGAVEFPFDWASGSTAVVAAAILGAVVLILTLMCYRAWRRRRTAAAGSGAQPGVAGASAEPDLTGRETEFLDAEKADANALGWPAAAADGVAASARPQVSGEPDAASRPAKTILIADDDPVVVFALKRRLQQLGFQVLRSPDSAHALMGAMKTRPDLVILDVNMPGGNGLAVCEMMASDPHYAGIPVIIHTSRADTATKQRCQQLGARYVEKSPQSWAEIGSHVETLIGGAGSETTTDRGGGEGEGGVGGGARRSYVERVGVAVRRASHADWAMEAAAVRRDPLLLLHHQRRQGCGGGGGLRGRRALRSREPDCPVGGRGAGAFGPGGQPLQQLGVHGDDGVGLEPEGLVGAVAARSGAVGDAPQA